MICIFIEQLYDHPQQTSRTQHTAYVIVVITIVINQLSKRLKRLFQIIFSESLKYID